MRKNKSNDKISKRATRFFIAVTIALFIFFLALLVGEAVHGLLSPAKEARSLDNPTGGAGKTSPPTDSVSDLHLCGLEAVGCPRVYELALKQREYIELLEEYIALQNEKIVILEN